MSEVDFLKFLFFVLLTECYKFQLYILTEYCQSHVNCFSVGLDWWRIIDFDKIVCHRFNFIRIEFSVINLG